MYGKKLKMLRKIEGWSSEQVANKLGITKQTYNHYENEKRKPGLEMIQKLAEIYDVNIDSIFGKNELVKEAPSEYVTNFKKLPIVGQISCGNGVLAYEEIEGYEEVPSSWLNGGKYLFLRAKGDSMVGARINDGDLLLIREQPEVEDGEIAAVLIDDEAVLKRVYRRNGTIILQSENAKYPPLIKSDDIKIIGKLKRVVLTF